MFTDSPETPAGAPRVFFLPPGVPFAAALAAGLRARLAGAPPEAMARIRLYLNARRTARALGEALEAGRPATWLPDMRLVGQLEAEARAAALPAPPSRLARGFALLRLTEAFLAATPGFGPPSAAPGLAASLRDLLDELQASGVTAAALRELDLAEHAAHWRRSADFLAILAEHWPRHLAEAEGGAPDPEDRRRRAVAATLAAWEAAPPPGPVIAAGSTGSTPATAELLRAVARLPQGALVLPGWDPEMPRDVWDALAAGARPEHPHHHLVRLLAGLGLGPADPRPWTEGDSPSPARRRLLTEALRPAPVTDAWAAALPAVAAEAPAATEGLTWIEAAHPRQEAAAIALLMAETAFEDGRTAALVTPDRALARRVAAELGRWGVVPDDSGGAPLTLSPPGVVLGLLAGAVGRPLETKALAALLRHPLVGGRGQARAAHTRHTRTLEARALRGGAAEVDWDRLERAVAEHPATRRKGLPEGFAPWLAALRAALEPLAAPPREAAEAARRHLAAAEALSAGLGEAPGPLWELRAGAAARAFAEAFLEAAESAPPSPVPPAYAALWSAFAAGESAPEEAAPASARLRLLGTLEARAETADLVILGGLNEGTWPPAPGADPWLGRELRRRLGLPAPEARTGLSAHDFLCAANAPHAVLSRAERDDSGPTVPSRWLSRLEALLNGAAAETLTAAKARGAAVIEAARALDLEPEDSPFRIPAARPEPRPPAEARPRRLSITEIETLVRDPYAIYARRVLGLDPLEPLGRAPDARERGTILHLALERFAEATADWPPETPEDALAAALLDAAESALADEAPWPAERRLWRARFLRAAPWFAAEEAARRRAGARLAGTEVKGKTTLPLPGGEFELRGRADRADRLADGRLAIYDYKTGKPPSAKQIRAFARQLQLGGLIAEAGGFEGLEAAEIGALAYIGLTGSGEGGETREVDLSELSVAETRAELIELLARYEDPATPYPSRLRPAFLAFDGDYDRLARRGEWPETGETPA